MTTFQKMVKLWKISLAINAVAVGIYFLFPLMLGARSPSPTAAPTPMPIPAANNAEATRRAAQEQLFALVQNNNRTAVEKILQTNPGIMENCVLRNGRTPLMLACSMGDAEMVGTLLRYGASEMINFRSPDNYSPIIIAAEQGDEKVIAVLCQYDVQLNERGGQKNDPPLLIAMTGGQIAAAKYLIAAGADVNAIDHHSGTPLIMCAHQRYADLVKPLIEKGARLDIGDAQGQTAIWWAAHYGFIDAVKALVEGGAASVVNQANNEGVTPLMAAMMAGDYPQTIELLLQAGADPTIKNRDGRTVFDFSNSDHREKASAVLYQYYARRGNNSGNGTMRQNQTSPEEAAEALRQQHQREWEESQRNTAPSTQTERYYCPNHPGQTWTKPGVCPQCRRALVRY